MILLTLYLTPIYLPFTALNNWSRELESWCPTLNTLVYYGTMKEREEIREEVRGKPKDYYNVCLTTYNIAHSKYDKSFLRKMRYKYIVLGNSQESGWKRTCSYVNFFLHLLTDEAQNIKNINSLRYKSLFALRSEHRLLLTGTPLQVK